MMPSPFLRFIENRFARRPPKYLSRLTRVGDRLKDGTRVLVVGAGIAGSAFARQLLRLTRREGIRAEVVLLNGRSCNYCGGLITGLSARTFEGLFDLPVPEDRILTQIHEVIYSNPAGFLSVPFHAQLSSILRTSRFGELGFDDAVRERITQGLSPNESNQLKLIEPARVLSMSPPTDDAPALVKFVRSGGREETLRGDVLVVATGLKSLGSRLMTDFAATSGYRPPDLMPAGVTEIDVSSARLNRLEHGILVIDGVIPNCVVAMIPKRKNWLTLTSLGKTLTFEDLNLVFSQEAVKRFIELDQPGNCLRCHTICRASVFVSPARHVVGRGWLVIGDLTGRGRVLKDGYFAALDGADLAANVLVGGGLGEANLKANYEGRLNRGLSDNTAGIALFKLNARINRTGWFQKLLVAASASEKEEDPCGGPIHTAIRAINTGELSYRWIWALFLWGFARYAARWPLRRLLRVVGWGRVSRGDPSPRGSTLHPGD